jgi:micrococcal nuclease
MRLVTIVSLLAAFALQVAHAQSAGTTASVVRVIDGDTVDVRLENGSTDRLRLIGIDTPEVVDPRKPVQCFGREASAHAHELLDGQTVSIDTDPTQGDRDTFGRLLAYVWLSDGRNFGEVMIADGYAHEYTYDLPYAYRDSFTAAQTSAITSQAGLWSPGTCAGNTEQPADNLAADSPEPHAPALLPLPAEPAPAPKPAAPAYSGRYDLFGPDRDCKDFRTHAEAQAFFIAAGGPAMDRHRLDADHDGIACETLP